MAALLGDNIDLAEWSDKYLRPPNLRDLTQPALFALYGILRRMREYMPSREQKIVVLKGNHELRMENAIARNLIQACDLRAVDEFHLPPAMSVPRLLALHTMGVDYVDEYPGGERWLNDAVRLSHGEIVRAPGDTAKAVVAHSDVTEIFGHIHRVEWASRTLHHRRGRTSTITGFSPGCTCWVDGRVPGSNGKSQRQWQNGQAAVLAAAVVTYEPEGSLYEIRPIVFGEDGRSAMFNGHVYRTSVGEDGPPYNHFQEGYECLEAHA